MKKVSMFSDGTLVVAEGKNVRKASKNEVSDFLKSASNEDITKFLSSHFPSEKKGNPLEFVRLDKESGFAYGKYANDSKVLKSKVIVAQSAPATQTEPVDSGNRTKEHKGESEEFETPRSEKHSKPQEFKGRDDVNKPTEVRDGNYEKGQGGKDLHTDVVPRDSSGDGVGGESTTFDKEKSDDAKSSNPDTYVQDWEPNEEPAKAGTKENRAVAETKKKLDVKFASEDLKFKFAGDSNKDHNKEEDKEEKDDKPKKDKMPPWLKDKKDESDEKAGKEKEAANAKVVELTEKLADAQKQLQKLEREVSNRKVAEARKEAAIGLVLAYRDRQPAKYASAEKFVEKVTDISKKMSVEAIDSALEEFNTLIVAESERQQKIAQSADQLKSEGNSLSHSVVIPQSNYKFADTGNDATDLASILMQNTSLGKKVSNMDRYRAENNE